MQEKVLCVDDDPGVLAGFRRKLRKDYALEIALGGDEALETIRRKGPFAVIMTDMCMPCMDGIQLLSAVRERAPDTVRMMLTGHADLRTAVEAVNEGNIFRFLIKPVRPEVLAKALRDAIEQYRLITAERQLLQETLTGCVKVLTEILSMTNPTAFSRASRIKDIVRQIADELELPNLWQFELAAMLSQIGCVALPPSVVEKGYARGPLSKEEHRMFASHPLVAAKLLAQVPRLEPIARMIEGQQRPPGPEQSSVGVGRLDTVALGSQILRVALALDQLMISGLSSDDLTDALRRREGEFNPGILAALGNVVKAQADLERTQTAGDVVEQVSVRGLRVGMVAYDDIRAENGQLLLPKGQDVTLPVLARLCNYAEGVGVIEPIWVRPSAQQSADLDEDADLAA